MYTATKYFDLVKTVVSGVIEGPNETGRTGKNG